MYLQADRQPATALAAWQRDPWDACQVRADGVEVGQVHGQWIVSHRSQLVGRSRSDRTDDKIDLVERYTKEFDFKMVQLQANMHAYRPDRALDWLRPAMEKCADLGLMVKVHTGDGPYAIPTEFYPIIREFPSVNFILAHFGVQTGGVYVFEPFQMAMDAPNIYVESGWCLQSFSVYFLRVKYF